MPYSKKNLPSSWITLWTMLFVAGMIAVFSFLLGNPFFSGAITGKYLFSSFGSSLYIDGKFFDQNTVEGNVSLGMQEMCAMRYGKKTQCIKGEVRSNRFPVLRIADVTLLPRKFRIDTLAERSIYFDPVGNGVFWVDVHKNVIWKISPEDADITAIRIQENIFKKDKESSLDSFSVVYDEAKKLFLFSSPSLQKKVEVSFSNRLLTFDEVKGFLLTGESDQVFSESGLIQKDFHSLEDAKEDVLMASFSDPLQAIFPYGSLKILEFPSSLWIFDLHQNGFQKISYKDTGTRSFWHEKTSSLLFLQKGKLKRIFLK